ncbi:DNA/RNA non-specific endonuclease [Acetobacter musti]|uniref:DNA/RNA non-specific endonuclease n=1 Tax=Acetobacter musti TaxID=864732 RepID=A0ABX0JSL9_9PROT|nr:DNA/RNA non-specific endonuclease [Acetobacter musti]NHN86483.1 DNA/RNA non-specific endonuclease [Acetobacter musti]
MPLPLRFRCPFSVILLLIAPVFARADCPDHFAGQKPPATSAPVTLLCSTGFAAGYSGPDHESLWSAEHLTKESIIRAQTLQGRAPFHEDLRLPPAERSELSDYRRSGWSRGHLTPSGDAPTRAAREETFALSNIVPQAAKMNSGAWNRIEGNLRKIVRRKGEAWVVTGPAFREPLGSIGPDHVRVPSSVWKAVLVPSLSAVSVVVCRNTTPYQCNTVAMDSLRRVTGVDPFPAVPPAQKTRNRSLDALLLR